MQGLPSKQPPPGNSSTDPRQSRGSPSSTPSAMEYKSQETRDDDSPDVAADGYVELTLISAQGLKDVKMFGTMSPYAIVWIDPSCKHRTSVSKNTGSSPAWDYYLRLPISSTKDTHPLINSQTISRINSTCSDDADASNEDDSDDHQRLTIQIFSQGAISDALVGTAHIPLQDIIHNAAGKLQYLACQLVRPSGRIQGLINLSVQFKASSSSQNPLLPHDSLPHLHGKGLQHNQPGQNRNSWFFLAEGVEEDGGEASAASQAKPITAPDFLDFKVDGDHAGGAGGASRSSSSANESMNASAPHSPMSSHSEFPGGSPLQQPNQHQHQHQQADASKAIYDSAFNALVLADVANDVAGMVMPPGDGGSLSVGDSLWGLAMSQSLHGDGSSFGPSPSS